MKKSQNPFMHKVKENIKLQIIICLSFCFIVILISFLINKLIDERIKLRKYTIVEEIKLINSVEKLDIENKRIKLIGYAFMLGRDATNDHISVFLKNVGTNKEIWLDTEYKERQDVNLYYNSEYDYTNSGFIAYTNMDRLNHNEIYEIIIRIKSAFDSDNIETTVSANTYILDNKIYAYNPNKFDIPESNSSMLKEVFDNGQLCFYRSDVGMYVYQYNGKLYWIATKDFEFNEEGLTYIPYQLFTTQINRLPKERASSGYDKLNFYFEEQEYKEQTTVPYRVAIQDIPQEYAIAYIKTGVYDGKESEWIWAESFHLNNVIGVE